MPKINYIVEVLKHASHLGKKVVFVVENNLVDHIGDTWKKSSMDLNTLRSQIKLLVENNPSFVEYIERLVLLDLILDNFIQNNFVKYKSFPFLGENC